MAHPLKTLAAVALALSLGTASAAGGQPAIPPVAPQSTVVIHNDKTPLITVFAWERNGEFLNAWPGDGKEVPYDAARNQVKLFRFKAGDVRELHFAKGSRTHPHFSREDIITYGVTARRVQITNEQSFQNEPGDASFQPNGVNHHGETLVGGVAIEMAFPGTKWADPQAKWVSGRNVPLQPVAAWREKGRTIEVVGPAARKAPARAVRFSRKTFRLTPPYVLEEIHLPKGARTPPAMRDTDLLLYVVKGEVRVNVDGPGEVAVSGDAARAPSGTSLSLEALEDTVLVQAAAPRPRAVALKK
jgi:quercetin dioxygenase-like cupin family protein